MLRDLQSRILLTIKQLVSPAVGWCTTRACKLMCLVPPFLFLSVYHNSVYGTVHGCALHVYILTYYKLVHIIFVSKSTAFLSLLRNKNKNNQVAW